MVKKISIILFLVVCLVGCNSKLTTPYGKIATNQDSQIFVYSDADVSVKDGWVKSDDTTLIVVAVKNEADVLEVFKKAMEEIGKIFKERSGVYKKWLKQ